MGTSGTPHSHEMVPVPPASAAGGLWTSPLGSWLRGFVDDLSGPVPSMGRVFDGLRAEFDKSPVLGVLFIRLEYGGTATDRCGWADLERVYGTVSDVTLDLVGKGLRRVDLPVDIGLHGEGLAVFLSAPRGETVLALSTVDAVGERVASIVRSHLVDGLPSDIAQRLSLQVGSGLLRRSDGASIEDAVMAGLIEADSSSRAKQRASLEEAAVRIGEVLDQGLLSVTYQPLVDLASGRTAGFEAFAHGPRRDGLHLSDVFLQTCRRARLGVRAADAYHGAAVAGAAGIVAGEDILVLQVSASALLESAVRGLSLLYRRHGSLVTPGNVAFMIDAAEVAAYFPPMLAASRSVGDMGFRIGVNLRPDGPMPLDLLRELSPDFLRVGARTVRNLVGNQDELEFVQMLSRFAARHDMRTIASDCDTQAELLALRRSGVDLVQGESIGAQADRPVASGVDLP